MKLFDSDQKLNMNSSLTINSRKSREDVNLDLKIIIIILFRIVFCLQVTYLTDDGKCDTETMWCTEIAKVAFQKLS